MWSPDSQKISYTDNSQSIYWIDLRTGKSKKVASQQTYTPRKPDPPRVVAGLEVAGLHDRHAARWC